MAFFITLIVPQHMRESTDWSFQYAAQNFMDGHLTVGGVTIELQEAEAARYGGLLSQYVLVEDNNWGLTEAPGYIFYLLPFYAIHAPELGNLLLAAGMTFVAYLLLRRLRDEKTACIGSLLVLFTPVALAMMQRVYADTFAAAAFLSIGGGLYIYYCLRREELGGWSGAVILFLAGLGLGWSVFASYYNAPAALVFALHFIYMFARSLRAGQVNRALRDFFLPVLGLIIPIAGLLVYQNAVFGSPWRFGFQYAQLPVSFSPRFISGNIKYAVMPLLAGFPLLLPGFASICVAFYQKIPAFIRRRKGVTVADTWPELRWDILLLLAGWACAVFGLNINYEWTADTQVIYMPFIMTARYYLPAAFPLTIMAVLLFKRLPRKLTGALIALALVLGILFFAQSALSWPVVPPHSPYNPFAASLAENQNSILETSSTENRFVLTEVSLI